MLVFINIQNPYDISDVKRVHRHGKWSIRQHLEAEYPGFTEFEHPTIALVNNEAWKRERWGEVLPDDSVVVFTPLPGFDPITWVYIAVMLVVGIGLGLYMRSLMPTLERDQEEAFSIRGQLNQNNLDAPIEVLHGRPRHWPSYAFMPYQRYVNNEQYLYQGFVIGQGEHEINLDDVYIEDTPIADFKEVTVNFYAPGQNFTMFRDNVVTSGEVQTIELLAPNEEEYDGWSGPYTLGRPSALIDRIEVDLLFPMGIHYRTDKGRVRPMSVDIRFEKRRIDENGDPLEAWSALRYFIVSRATDEVLRETWSVNVPPGRYQVRGKRFHNDLGDKYNSKTLWESLKYYLPDRKEYGGVTVAGVAIRASRNLNQRTRNRFNLFATRKLPIWHPDTGWSAPSPTRSMVWAACDVVRAHYGGNLPDTVLNLESLYELDQKMAALGVTFDYAHTQRSTVWDALQVIAMSGRCFPVPTGASLTMVRDEPRELVSAVLTDDVIVKDSFSWEFLTRKSEDFDGLEITYTDANTWADEKILIRIDDDVGANPEKLRLHGVTSRTIAYRHGLYFRARMKYALEDIQLSVGLEGRTFRKGDHVLLSHRIPRWGQAGWVVSLDGTLLTLSKPVVFEEGEDHVVSIRDRYGERKGPFAATPGPEENQIVVAGLEGDFIFDRVNEPPIFTFGKEEMDGRVCVVEKLTPSESSVECHLIPYDERWFAFDNAAPPPIDDTDPPPIVTTPGAVTGLAVTQDGFMLSLVQVSWDSIAGVAFYRIEHDQDNDGGWELVTEIPATVHVFPILAGEQKIRVRAHGVNPGPWTEWEGTLGNATALPEEVIDIELLGRQETGKLTVVWNQAAQAQRYIVQVFRTTPIANSLTDEVFVATYEVTQTAFDWTVALMDGFEFTSRGYSFYVRAENNIGRSATPVRLPVLINPPPKVILSLTARSEDDDEAGFHAYILNWFAVPGEMDFKHYRVVLSTTNGFDPYASGHTVHLVENRLTTNKLVLIPLDDGVPVTHFFRVAAVDVWDEEWVQYSNQASIPAGTAPGGGAELDPPDDLSNPWQGGSGNVAEP